MKWYIGQDIVCIKTHSQGIIKEGDVFTIKELQQSCCMIHLHIGLFSSRMSQGCRICNKIILKNSTIHWLGETLFAPLENVIDITEIEELLKEPIFQT